ncbi:hypothetical protein ACOL3H_07105 [Aliarcobacter butzleri]
MKKWLLSAATATLIFTGCIPNSGIKENTETKKLREFAAELNTYANETYKLKNKSCTDYGIKKFSLITMTDDGFADKLTIEIKDNKPLVETNVGSFLIILKNDLIDILNSKDLLKKNIDTYIDSCSNNSSNKTDVKN